MNYRVMVPLSRRNGPKTIESDAVRHEFDIKNPVMRRIASGDEASCYADQDNHMKANRDNEREEE
jgi:hypothetical protein